MLLSNSVNESRTERSETISATSSLSVKIYESFRPKTNANTQNTTPRHAEVQRTTLMAKFAAFAFPLPNSFDTRTLCKLELVLNYMQNINKWVSHVILLYFLCREYQI